MNHHYGWRPDLPDFRDDDYMFAAAPGLVYPATVDLRSQMPPIYNQSKLGSCTGHGIAAAIQYDRMKQGLDNWTPSRLLIYLMERMKEHTVSLDAGARIRDGVKCVAKLGTCDEKLWPYDISKFNVMPPQSVFEEAKEHPALAYRSVAFSQIDGALASGFPVIYGVSLYSSFESDQVAKTGIVPLPVVGEKLLGGHCMLLAGYLDNGETKISRNSWGEEWGDKGYCYIPDSYLERLARDCWIVTVVQ